jgi:hypothetical protein
MKRVRLEVPVTLLESQEKRQDSRTPTPKAFGAGGNSMRQRFREASWSAAVICRFFFL